MPRMGERCLRKAGRMNIIGLISGLLIVICAFVITWPLANIFVPQSEIDKIDAIGNWAKEELDRREVEGRE